MKDHPDIPIPPPGTPCDICHHREATGGVVYRKDGRDVVVNHCDECEHKVPTGHTGWGRADSEPSPREPNALCDSCGAQGTVARITQTRPNHMVTRFCDACWPRTRARLEAEREAAQEAWLRTQRLHRRAEHGAPEAIDPRLSIKWVSRSWSDTREFLDLMMRHGADEPTLTELANEIRATAPDMFGPMPEDIAEFVRRYQPPAV